MGETYSHLCGCGRNPPGEVHRVAPSDAHDTKEYNALVPKDSATVVQHLKDAQFGHHALKSNTYDALTWSLVKMSDPEMAKIKGKAHLIVGFIIPLVMNVVAVTLQLLAIFGLLQFTIARAQDVYTTGGESQRASTALLRESIASGIKLNETAHHHLLHMCQTDHNVPYTQSVLTWLWGMKLLPAISQAVWVMALTMRMPRAGTGEHLVEKNSKDKHLDIVRMGLGAKTFNVLCIDVPRVLVSFYLYWMGANFLMYAKSLGVLIMKSVGLAFIQQIPEVIFAGSFSEGFQKEMKQVKLAFATEDEDGDDMCHGMENWNLFGSTLVKFFTVLLVSLYYCRIMCGDLQDLRQACIGYKYKFVLPECPQCGSHLFGFTLYN